MDYTIINNGGQYNDKRLNRGRYPKLWCIDSAGKVYVGIKEITDSGRVINPVKHVKDGIWSNTTYECNGYSGDIFLKIALPFNLIAFPNAHSIDEAREWLQNEIKRNIDRLSFMDAMEKCFPNRTKELDELEAKLDALSEKFEQDIEILKLEFKKSKRSEDGPLHDRVWLGGKSYLLEVLEGEDGPYVSGKLPDGCKIISVKDTGETHKGGKYYIAELSVPASMVTKFN